MYIGGASLVRIKWEHPQLAVLLGNPILLFPERTPGGTKLPSIFLRFDSYDGKYYSSRMAQKSAAMAIDSRYNEEDDIGTAPM